MTEQNSSRESSEKGTKKGNTGIGVNGNLIPASLRPKEEVLELSRKGGLQKGINEKRRRDLREIARALLESNMTTEQAEDVLGEYSELLDGDTSTGAVLTARMVVEAAQGNYKAYETVRDTAGYKPTDKVELDATVTDADRELLEKVSNRLQQPQQP